MIVLSRDAQWLTRLERAAARGGWPFEKRAAVPAPARTPQPERALVVLDRGLAGASPRRAVKLLRGLYPTAAIALAFAQSELDVGAASAAVSCGADEIVGKFWSDEKLSSRLAVLRDRALAAQTRLSADGALKAERRAHRVFVKSRGAWREVRLDAGGFALLWRFLEREGAAVSRAEQGAVLAGALGREIETGSVARRLSVLKKALAAWPGELKSGRGGAYLLASASRRRSTT